MRLERYQQLCIHAVVEGKSQNRVYSAGAVRLVQLSQQQHPVSMKPAPHLETTTGVPRYTKGPSIVGCVLKLRKASNVLKDTKRSQLFYASSGLEALAPA
eukprot:6190381-Pleurochrysis_carterae.AAC.1